MIKRLWKTIGILLISICLVISNLSIPTKAYSKNLKAPNVGLKEGPISEIFTRYMNGESDSLKAGVELINNSDISNNGQISNHKFGHMPSPLILPNIKPKLSLAAFPDSYDLRQQGKLTAVKNQLNSNSCWAFATYGSLESCILPNGSYDFSENNLKNTSGFDYGPNGGGYADMSIAYLARWSGPISESDDPFNPTSTTSPSGKPAQKHIQEVIRISDRINYSDNNAIKDAIMKYGAMYTSMYFDEYDKNYNATYKTYYDGLDDWKTKGNNHAVAIVGWDDNFDRNKFYDAYANKIPEGNGAFIIRNSWGNGWGENGYFYISYYDHNIGRENAVFNNAESTSNYSRIYQYDPLGLVSRLGYNTDTAWFANVFTAAANETLSAVSFYTVVPNASYEVYVCSDYNGINDLSSDRTLRGTGTINYAGYHTIKLNSSVALSYGKQFAVIIKLVTPGDGYPIPVERYYSGYSSGVTGGPGQSFYSSEGTNWGDLTSTGIAGYEKANVCLKAFTIPFGDTTPPTVLSTIPTNGASGVAVGSTITVKFSESVQTGTYFNNILVKNSSGNAIFSTNTIIGDTLTIDPIFDLSGSTQYTVTIPAGAVKDSSSNSLVNQYTFNFTTAVVDQQPPTVLSTIPVSGATSVAVNTNIIIKFSENVIIGINYDSITIKNPTGATVNYSPMITGDSLTLDPVGDLNSNTLYTVTIPSGAVKDQAGNVLSSQYVFSFTTLLSGTSPTILSTTPGGDSYGVAPDTSIQIKFSKTVQPGTYYNNITVKNNIGTEVTTTKRIDGDTLTIDPVASLSENTKYTVNIPAGAVKDLTGNILQNLYSFSFTTMDANAIIPKLIFDKAAYGLGGSVKLDLVLTNIKYGDKTNSVTFTIDFDGNAFELATGNKDSDIRAGYIPITTRNIIGSGSTSKIEVMYTDMNNNITLLEDQPVFSVYLKVKSTASLGNKTFTLEPVSMLDSTIKVYNVNNNQPVSKVIPIVNCAFIEGYASIYLGEKGSDINNLILSSLSQSTLNSTFGNMEFVVKKSSTDSGVVYRGNDIFVKDGSGNLAIRNANGIVVGRFRISTTYFDGTILSIGGAGYLAKNLNISINPGDTINISTELNSTELYPGDVGSLSGSSLVLIPDGKIDNLDFSAWLKTYNDSISGTADPDKKLNADFTKDNKINNLDFSLWLASYKKTHGLMLGSKMGNNMTAKGKFGKEPSIIPEISFSKDSYRPGETVDMVVRLKDVKPGSKTNSVMFEINYDEKVFELLAINDVYINFTSKKDVKTSTGKKIQVMYVSMDKDVELKDNEIVFTASFEVRKDAHNGLKKFVLAPINMFDSDLNAYIVNEGKEVEKEIAITLEEGSAPSIKNTNISGEKYADISTREPIKITFTEAIKKGENFNGIKLMQGSKVVKVTIKIIGSELIIQPVTALDQGKEYVLIIPKGAVESIIGIAQEEEYEFKFSIKNSRIRK